MTTLQWRATVDSGSNYPSDLKPSQRKAVLSKLDPMLSILKAAITIDGVEFQAARSFDGNPIFPGLPWPRSIGLYGFEIGRDGKPEGESATMLRAFANHFEPIISPITVDQDERLFALIKNPRTTNRGNINFEGILLVTKPNKRLFRPVSRREYVERLRTHYRRRMAKWPQQADSELNKMNAEFAALSPEEQEVQMVLRTRYPAMRDTYGPIPWAGFSDNAHPVVAIDMSYFDMSKRDALQFVVLLTNGFPARIPKAAERVRKYYRAIDYNALRALLK